MSWHHVTNANHICYLAFLISSLDIHPTYYNVESIDNKMSERKVLSKYYPPGQHQNLDLGPLFEVINMKFRFRSEQTHETEGTKTDGSESTDGSLDGSFLNEVQLVSLYL